MIPVNAEGVSKDDFFDYVGDGPRWHEQNIGFPGWNRDRENVFGDLESSYCWIEMFGACL